MGIGKCNGLRAGTVGQVGAHRSEAVSWGEKQSAIAADALMREAETRAREVVGDGEARGTGWLR